MPADEPTGPTARDWTFQAVTQEVLGADRADLFAREDRAGNGSGEALQPIPVAWTISPTGRRIGSASPRLAPEKRAAILYYDREMGKNELMRGARPGCS